jgi:hypothetical protein
VVESPGRVWLFTIDVAGWHPSSGERVAKIGPLPVRTDPEYSAQYMEAIFTPGIDRSRTSSFGLGGMVHIGGRNVFGDA